MTKHKTGTREQWLTARLELLEAEKELCGRQRRKLGSGSRSCRGSGSTRGYQFETEEGSGEEQR